MSEAPQHPLGSIGWADLTVPDGSALKDFYEAVVGWTATPLDMGGYADYLMQHPAGDAPVAGICHARGANAAVPAQWIVYITVADLDASLAACTARGGAVLTGPRSAGPGARFCIIRDPAGAVCALYAKDVTKDATA
jgi:hypothetical protein